MGKVPQVFLAVSCLLAIAVLAAAPTPTVMYRAPYPQNPPVHSGYGLVMPDMENAFLVGTDWNVEPTPVWFNMSSFPAQASGYAAGQMTSFTAALINNYNFCQRPILLSPMMACFYSQHTAYIVHSTVGRLFTLDISYIPFGPPTFVEPLFIRSMQILIITNIVAMGSGYKTTLMAYNTASWNDKMTMAPAPMWRQVIPQAGGMITTPVFADGKVFITINGLLYSVDAMSGAINSAMPTDPCRFGNANTGVALYSLPVGDAQHPEMRALLLLNASMPNTPNPMALATTYLCRLMPATGAVMWRVPIQGALSAASTVASGPNSTFWSFNSTGNKPFVLGLDATFGSMLFRIVKSDAADMGPVVLPRPVGTAKVTVLMTMMGTLQAVDAFNDGAVQWTTMNPFPCSNALVPSADGSYVGCASASGLALYRAMGGVMQWMMPGMYKDVAFLSSHVFAPSQYNFVGLSLEASS